MSRSRNYQRSRTRWLDRFTANRRADLLRAEVVDGVAEYADHAARRGLAYATAWAEERMLEDAALRRHWRVRRWSAWQRRKRLRRRTELGLIPKKTWNADVGSSWAPEGLTHEWHRIMKMGKTPILKRHSSGAWYVTAEEWYE